MHAASVNPEPGSNSLKNSIFSSFRHRANVKTERREERKVHKQKLHDHRRAAEDGDVDIANIFQNDNRFVLGGQDFNRSDYATD